MKKNKKLVFIGAGTANFAGVIELLNAGYPGELITIIEKGTDLKNRDRKDILYSGGGSGSISDNKVVFSELMDKPLNPHLGLDEVKRLYNKYIDQMKQFHPDFSKVEIHLPGDLPDSLKEAGVHDSCSMNNEWNDETVIKQSTVYHVGSYWGTAMYYEMENFIKNSGVNYITKTEVVDIDFDKKEVYTEALGFIQLHQPRVYKYDELFIATGKSSRKIFEKFFDKVGIKAIQSEAHVGIRMEIDFTKQVEEVVKFNYDFKFAKNYKNGQIRSFCCNSKTAKLVSENYTLPSGKKYTGPNGMAYGMDVTPETEKYVSNTTNFGCIYQYFLKPEDGDAATFTEKIMKNLDYKTILFEGKDINFKSTYDEYDKLTRISKEDFIKAFGDDLGYNMFDFIESLDKILKFGENYRFIGIEFKPSSGMFLGNLDKEMKVKKLDSVYTYGDIVGTVGISSSVAGAIKAVQHLIEE